MTELVGELERQKANSKDIVARSDSIEAVAMPASFFESTKEKEGFTLALSIPTDSGREQFPLTEFAHKQVASKMNIPQVYYDKMRDANQYELLAKNVNAWIGSKDKRLIRVLDNEVRAVLSDRYRPIDNYDLVWSFLDTVKDYKEKGDDIEITACDITETRMYIRTLLPATGEVVKGDAVRAMLLLQNSEVGAGKMSVALGMFRMICSNGMWGDDIVGRVHLGSKLDEGLVEWSEKTLRDVDVALFDQVKDTVRTAMEPQLWNAFLAKTTKTANLPLTPPMPEIVDLTSKQFKLTDKEKDKLLDMFAVEAGTVAGKSQWGLANGITRLAKQADDADRQVELEKIGGEIILSELPSEYFRKVEA